MDPVEHLPLGVDTIAMKRKIEELVDFTNHLMMRIDLYSTHKHTEPDNPISIITGGPIFDTATGTETLHSSGSN